MQKVVEEELAQSKEIEKRRPWMVEMPAGMVPDKGLEVLCETYEERVKSEISILHNRLSKQILIQSEDQK